MKAFTPPYYLLVFSLAAPLRVASQCYFPPPSDGGQPDIAQDHIPCNEEAFTSMCCPKFWTCFSSGVCIVTDLSEYPSELSIGAAIRASCTNPAWDQSVCGDVCLDKPRSYDRGQLTSCGNSKWCCSLDVANGSCNCDNGLGVFSIREGTAQTIIGITGLAHTSTVVPTPTSRYTATSSSSALSSDTAVTSSLMTLTSSASSGTLVGAQSTAISGASATSTVVSKKKLVTDTTGFKAGMGAGIGVAALAVIIFLLWRFRRRRAARRNPSQQVELYPRITPIVDENYTPKAPSPHPYASRKGRRTGPDMGSQNYLGVPTRPYGRAREPTPTNGSDIEELVRPVRRRDLPTTAAPPRYSYDSPEDVR